MTERFFIRKNNIITGPFERKQVLFMLKDGRLQLSDQLSTDKQNWQTPSELLALVVTTPADKADPCPVKITAITENGITQSEEEFSAVLPDGGDSCDSPEEPQLTGSSKFADIFACTAGAVGNSGENLKMLSNMGANALIISGVTAALLSILLSLLGGLLFNSCYDQPPLAIYVKNLTILLLSGGVFWLTNCLIRVLKNASGSSSAGRPEADFCPAMLGMMNISAVTVVIHAVMFVFNRRLFDLSGQALLVLLASALLPVIFLLGNTFVLLRLTLMGNAGLRSGSATFCAAVELYIVSVFYFLLQYFICKI